jgi:hypothetical protein
MPRLWRELMKKEMEKLPRGSAHTAVLKVREDQSRFIVKTLGFNKYGPPHLPVIPKLISP